MKVFDSHLSLAMFSPIPNLSKLWRVYFKAQEWAPAGPVGINESVQRVLAATAILGRGKAYLGYYAYLRRNIR